MLRRVLKEFLPMLSAAFECELRLKRTSVMAEVNYLDLISSSDGLHFSNSDQPSHTQFLEIDRLTGLSAVQL